MQHVSHLILFLLFAVAPLRESLADATASPNVLLLIVDEMIPELKPARGGESDE